MWAEHASRLSDYLVRIHRGATAADTLVFKVGDLSRRSESYRLPCARVNPWRP